MNALSVVERFSFFICPESGRKPGSDASASLRFGIIYAERIHGDGLHHLIFIGSVVVGGGFRNAVYRVHTFYYLSEGSITSVQVRGILMHDEELASRGVGILRSGHREDAGSVFQGIVKTVTCELAGNTVAGAAGAGALRAASLDHKAADHTVKDQAVIKSLADQADEIIDRYRCDVGVKLRFDNVSVLHGDGNDRILCHNIVLS